MKFNISLSTLLLLTIFLTSCTKYSDDKQDIYTYIRPKANPISDTICGSISGTMLSGKTYVIRCDVFINQGDTLLIEPGVHVKVLNKAGIIVSGTLLSLGTKANPVWIGADVIDKTDEPGIKAASKDSAYIGLWQGISADANCQTMILKWTHVEYCGAPLSNVVAQAVGLSAGNNSYALYFQNAYGSFVFEDSWLYGSNDDAIRVSSGNFAILRSTFEKCGKNGGEAINVKSGAVGDMAYNLFIGSATNSMKASNKGAAPTQTNVIIYNNTVLNGGFRQSKPARGGSINFEEGAKGQAYNNLIVNCRYGLRVVSNPAADIAHLKYGYNYYWADNVAIAGQIYPTGYITIPQHSDFPSDTSYLPTTYKIGDVYDGTKAVQVGNPLFTSYSLPTLSTVALVDVSAVYNYTFTLQNNSSCIGKGFTQFSPRKSVVQDIVYGVSEYTLPGIDIGCYQMNGRGNRHY